jgi:V/A-type H+-transporting ATPase subunit I
MAEFTAARRGGLEEGQLFAVQGWVPRGRMETLADDLAGQGVDAAVETVDPDPDEKPPTLIRYPRWARPIEALFDILGTVPGYREMDLSPFFMVALPIFAAMLIGDAGYGLVFTLVGLLGYGKIRRAASKSAAQLVLIFGLVTLAWGVLNANYFGLTPPVNEAGEPVGVGKLMAALGPIWDSNDEQMRDTVIQISFIFGTIHLVLAHLRAAFEAAPSQKSVAELGWCGFLAGMLGVVWLMFFPEQVWMPQPVLFALLGGGAGLIVLFSFPQRNPAKRLALGVVGNLMALIAAFSDTMSYIRLMAVGLASYYIAFAFNGLAAQIGSAGWWMIPFAVLILLFAHLLNIALGLIAIFAHGVRLNMLEFSSNAGVQWEGYPFSPFARAATEGER